MTERPDQQQTPDVETSTAATTGSGPRQLVVTVFSILVILVGLGVGIAAWAGAFGDSDEVGDDAQITQRIEALAASYNNKDLDGFADSFCSTERAQIEEVLAMPGITAEQVFPADEVQIHSIDDIVVDGDQATAEVEMTLTDASGESFEGTETHVLVRENGDWLICG